MRIAMIGWEFPPFVSGGLGIHCYELTKNLTKKGIEIDFYMPKTRYSVKADELSITQVKEEIDVKIVEIEASALSPYPSKRVINMESRADSEGLKEVYGWDFLQAVKNYNRRCVDNIIMSGKNYDIIHNHDWITVPAAIQISEHLKKPHILTIHSTEYDRSPFPWENILNIERDGVKHADIIITVSNRMKRTLIEKFGADERKIRVIYNAVDPKKFEVHRTDKKRKKIVLFLGRLTEQKGPEQFIYAAKRVIEKEPNTRFVIVGKGPLLPHLISLSLRLGLREHISFMGYIPDEELKKVYAQSDVYVMPSISEPFGITALEAMASGTPLIVSTTSGIAEITDTCLKVDFWDIDKMATYIIALLRYDVLAKVMSMYELLEVKEFTWDKTAERTIEVYEEVLRKR